MEIRVAQCRDPERRADEQAVTADWERQMTVWLNTHLDHQGPIGEGIRERESAPASSWPAILRFFVFFGVDALGETQKDR
jgi:hypothetical protein